MIFDISFLPPYTKVDILFYAVCYYMSLDNKKTPSCTASADTKEVKEQVEQTDKATEQADAFLEAQKEVVDLQKDIVSAYVDKHWDVFADQHGIAGIDELFGGSVKDVVKDSLVEQVVAEVAENT